MEWFTVQYRRKDGTREEAEFEAADKNALFKQLAEKSLSPISVRSGRVSRNGGHPKISPRLLRGLAAGLIVVLGAAIAFFFLSKPAQKPTSVAKPDTKRIKEVTPAAPRPRPAEESKPVEEEKKIDPNARPTKVGETVNGYILLPSGRMHRVLGVVTNSTTAAIKGKYEIFNHSSENEIACFLSMEPGQGLVGTPRYNGRFKRDFLQSLEEPIVVSPDDSPEDAALKRNVIQAKIDLKDALDRGEDIEQIMLDTRKELQDLGRFKQELTQQMHEIVKEDAEMSTEDMEALLEAANKMLDEKGIAPMTFGPLTRRKIMMMREQEKREGK